MPLSAVSMHPSTRFRRFDSVEELGEAAALRICDGLMKSASRGRRYLLGCPAGRTPVAIYQALSRECSRRGLDCSHLVIVMMDEYLDSSDGVPALVPETAHHSTRRFAETEIVALINGELPRGHHIPTDSLWLPDPAQPERYDARILRVGGIDLFIVASGTSDGHVGFCGPGSEIDGQTAVVELARSTRIDNVATFAEFRSVDDVPTRGVTVGLGTIRRCSRATVLVLHGVEKRQSVARVRAAASYDSAWPATFIHGCPNPEVWTDRTADPPDADVFGRSLQIEVVRPEHRSRRRP